MKKHPVRPLVQRPSVAGFRPVNRFDAATSGKRAAGWAGASVAGPIDEVAAGLETVRRRSRHEVANNPFASRAAEVFVSFVVGGGIRPNVADETVAALWERSVAELDADGVLDFYGQQALAAHSLFESGEVLARIRPRRAEDGLAVPLQVQLLEADYLPLANAGTTLPAGVRNGIEIDAVGRRVAYHLHSAHPGDGAAAGVLRPLLNGTVRIPADALCHVYRPARPGALRGMPILTAGMLRLHDLDGYEDAELVRKRMSALITAFLQKPTADADASKEIFGADESEDGQTVAPMEPGATIELPPGYEVKFNTPMDVGGSYEPFLRSQFRAVAAACGIPYELLTGDYSGVNDRLFRAVIQSFKRDVKRWQGILNRQMNARVWTAWLDAAVAAGRITPSQAAASRTVEWIAEPWGHIHPVQDAVADIRLIRAGLKSRSQAARERGYDYARVVEELAREQGLADAAGVRLDSDPRWRTDAGAGIVYRPEGAAPEGGA